MTMNTNKSNQIINSQVMTGYKYVIVA